MFGCFGGGLLPLLFILGEGYFLGGGRCRRPIYYPRNYGPYRYRRYY